MLVADGWHSEHALNGVEKHLLFHSIAIFVA